MSATAAAVEPAAAGSEGTPDASAKAVNVADVQSAIVRQVEFYFSDANLPTDKFLLKQVQSNPEGFVPIKLIAQFKRVKALSKDHDLVTGALKLSSELMVSADGTQVKRLSPLPDVNENDIKRRTVIVTNLAGVPSIESVTEQFSKYGPVKLVRICPPGSTEKLPQWLTGASPIVSQAAGSNQLFALVEFSSEESANMAVHDNNPVDWRESLMVRRLVPGPSRSPTPSANQQNQQNRNRNKQREGGQQGASRNQNYPNSGGNMVPDQLQQGMSNLRLFAGDSPLPGPSPRVFGAQFPGLGGPGGYRLGGVQHQQGFQGRNQGPPGNAGGGGNRGYQTQQAYGQGPKGGPNSRPGGPDRQMSTSPASGMMEAVLYTPPGTSGTSNDSPSQQRSTSVQPAQKFLLVRPRGGEGQPGPANSSALHTGPSTFNGYTAPPPPDVQRSVSVGRRAPHFVIDMEYRPPDEKGPGKQPGKVRPRGHNEQQNYQLHQQHQYEQNRRGGQGQQGGASPPLHVQGHERMSQNERKRGKSARGGPNSGQDMQLSGSPLPGNMLQAQGSGGAPKAGPSQQGGGPGGPHGVQQMPGLQGLAQGTLQLMGNPPVGQEQAWQQLISAVQQLVQHQFGGVPATAPNQPSPFSNGVAPGSAGATPANTAANSSSSTPGKGAQQLQGTPQQPGKKGKHKANKQQQQGEGAPNTPHTGGKEHPRDANYHGSKDQHNAQGSASKAGTGVFVFGQDSGEVDPASGQGTSKVNTPVTKASHGKKGGKGTPGAPHTPSGGSASKKKDGAFAGGDAGGGNGSGEETGEDVRKKRTKKDYANWAAATNEYRAQSAAAYSGAEGGAGANPMVKEGSFRVPKVPDGTKGFGMGRGRPLAPSPS